MLEKKFLKIAYPNRSKLRGITAIFRVGISNSPWVTASSWVCDPRGNKKKAPAAI